MSTTISKISKSTSRLHEYQLNSIEPGTIQLKVVCIDYLFRTEQTWGKAFLHACVCILEEFHIWTLVSTVQSPPVTQHFYSFSMSTSKTSQPRKFFVGKKHLRFIHVPSHADNWKEKGLILQRFFKLQESNLLPSSAKPKLQLCWLAEIALQSLLFIYSFIW